MRAFPVFVTLVLIFPLSEVSAQSSEAIRRMEMSGDAAGARAALAQAAESNPNNLAAATRYAEHLERYGDPASRDAYSKVLALAEKTGDNARTAAAARRLASLALLAGDRQTALRSLEAYRKATGKTLTLAEAGPRTDTVGIANIPGPLRSFARMAAIAGDSAPAEVLPALARNVVTNGYQASHSNESLEQTEYLKLVHRYLSQARELEKLAGEQKSLRVESCDSPNVAELLRVLGFRMRGGCGSEVVLETVNAGRAFLTTDSGFPVNELEQALRTNRPFVYDFRSTAVPVMYGPEFWLSGTKDKDKETVDFLDAFIGDPSMCRLYLGLSKLDRETAEALRKTVALPRLKAYAHVLDFFGGMFEIRNGKALVPGGQRSSAVWAELTGAQPDKGAEFFDKLMSKDDGWLASLYDALARIHGPVADYLTEPARMKRFYTAVRGRVTSPGPARPVFRANTDMMLLTTRLRTDSSGKPAVPGNLDVWKNLFTNHPQGKYDGRLTKAAASWKDADDVIEALFGLSRKAVDNEPLKIFMALSDIDRSRPKPLQAATADRLAREYRDFGAQYPIFTESRNLSDQAIIAFIDAAESISKIRDQLQRSDAAGTYQSLLGLWQILVRERRIPEDQADATFSGIVAPFATARNDRDVFDAGRNGVRLLLAAAGVKNGPPQQRMIELLGGSAEGADSDIADQMQQQLQRILDAQRIIPLDAIFGLADHIEVVAKGEKLNPALVNRLASAISEIQLPRSSLTTQEKNAMGYGFWSDRHIEDQRKLNLRSAIEKAAGDPEKIRDVRGRMAPLLRDTLMAFNYAHYAPPGAQILFTNPLFVRSHDFVGAQGPGHFWRATESYGSGWPTNAGGRLVGSLATLPYALAEAEQNFLIPAQTQALIWGDLVPQMILSAKIPRWWNVTPAQVHWAGLHLRYGRELIGDAAFDPELRGQLVDALWLHATPVRTSEGRRYLEEGDTRSAVERVTPSELFAVARDLAARRGSDDSCVLAEIRQLAQSSPNDVNYAAISRAFGTPKPTLANSYEPELLQLRTFPALMGYSSRILAESWESNTLYWAALADELSLPPSELNVRIPEWTQRLVEQIFASHLEDWPALLKSLRRVGEDVRGRSRTIAAADPKANVKDGPDR
jgi:hypothetical protein